MKNINLKRNLATMVAIVAMATGANPANADERGDLEQLRATTMSLIEALVETGVITRDKADKLISEAEQRAKARAAQSPPTVPATPPGAETGRDGKRVVRVPYVPESVKQEIREQLKQEVITQAREERWAAPNALPDWLSRFQFEGDVRLRYDNYRLDPGNTAPGNGHLGGTGATGATATTRAADLASLYIGGVAGINANTPTTQEDFSRTRLRARFGFNAKVADTVTAGMRVASGSTSGPTSTNQTLGQGFNKYSLVLDRAFITVQPTLNLTLTGGRIANPFMSTDLVWAEDLGFEGFVASYKPQVSPSVSLFATGGWFPLRSDSPQQSSPRNLTGAQGGLHWNLSSRTDLKLAAAVYQYHGLEGQLETAARFNAGGPPATDYGASQYQTGFRQRGNTLFLLNPATDTTNTLWGLASAYREFNLTGSLDIAAFGENHIILTGDYVKNLAFDRANMALRTGATFVDGRDYGYLGRILVGQPTMAAAGDWNISLAYRWLGSDAVLDAFTNSDFGLGGTNNKGYILGGSYAFDKHSWLSLRWMSSDLIDSMAPKTSGAAASTRLSTDLLQVDLNVKF